MNEPFILEIFYQGGLTEFPAAFQRYGFTYRIAVEINETTFLFEPDEEGKYRAIIENAGGDLPDKNFLAAVAEKLAKLN